MNCIGTPWPKRAPAPIVAAAITTTFLVACGGNDNDDGSNGSGGLGTTAPPLTCDDSMKAAFKPDANTNVTLVKAFKKGDPLALSGTPATPAPPVAANDVCLVKLTIGPGSVSYTHLTLPT